MKVYLYICIGSLTVFLPNVSRAYEANFACGGKGHTEITALKIEVAGTVSDVHKNNEAPLKAHITNIKFGKNKEHGIEFTGQAHNSAKGIFFELHPADGVKSKIKEILISAPASSSDSTLTDTSDKVYSMSCD